MFVTCTVGLEDLLMQELADLGIPDLKKGYGGVFAPQEMRFVYIANYSSRFATRVLWPLLRFRCTDKEALYRAARKIPWPKIFKLHQTFAIDANVSHPKLRNSLFASLVVKDAICDIFREHCGERPSVATYSPDVRLHLFIHNELAVLSIDSSGDPLYKRGYRQGLPSAPIQESLAGALLALAGYQPDKVFCDPFCGSGTFLIEAAMKATHTPPGFLRTSWGFMHFPQFSKQKWLEVKEEADKKRIPLEKGKIFGSDKDPKAIEMSRAHVKTLGWEGQIELEARDVRSYFPKTKPEFVMCNPPYGKRLAASDEIYKAYRHFLATRCAPSMKAFILSPEIDLSKKTGTTAVIEHTFAHGGLKVNLFSLTLDKSLSIPN